MKTIGLFFALGGAFALIGLAASAKGKSPKSKRSTDGRPTSTEGSLTLARPKLNRGGNPWFEEGKRYLLKGTVPSSLSVEELTEAFEENGHLESLNFAKSLDAESRGFQVIYTSPANWAWEIPGEVDTLRFPNRIVSAQEIIE